LENTSKISGEKRNRLDAIVEILEDNLIPDHGTLIQKLEEKLIYVTQATISRDFRDFEFYKEDGYYKAPVKLREKVLANRLKKHLSECHAQPFFKSAVLTIKTKEGYAQLMAKRIEEFFKEEVIGYITSETLALIVLRSDSDLDKIEKYYKDSLDC
jgi:arginine repressor